MKQIVIDPITRLEGHGKITIFLDDSGKVSNAYFQVPELRGFERFCEGRAAEDLPRITSKICGVCPGAHHIAATKALDALYNVEPPSAAKKLRELFYCAHMSHSHIAHFYALAGPDFIVGPDAPPAERNVLGVIDKVGLDIGKQVITARHQAQSIQKLMAGHQTAPSAGIPGGWTKPINEDERAQIEEWGENLLEFSKFTVQALHDIVLSNQDYLELITGDTYHLKTYYMGLVDNNNHVNFYDGHLRVVDPAGNEVVKFREQDYLEHIQEIPSEMSYLKFVVLKSQPFIGLKEGASSGIYQVAPLGRLNAADGLATPLAQAELEKMRKTVGHPTYYTLATHWARVIEQLYAAERLLELVKDPEITSTDIRAEPGVPDEGVGVCEAPRGTLLHHYKTDRNGIIQPHGANFIVATAHNHASICMSIKKAAKDLVQGSEPSDAMLNMVEMAFRIYDPCFACATHSLPGRPALDIRIVDATGKEVWNSNNK
ncbi:MAG: Ni/Fe hydrogenase subunit alpha [Candidatus Hodarchaeales archaeon]|jgi:F420-non-reducing hydrogenase large subunit